MSGFGFGGTGTSGTTTGFGTGFGFGNQPKTTSSGFGFGLGTSNTTSSSLGFGGTGSNTSSFGFGSTNPTSSAPSFGFGTSAGTSAPAFGLGTSTATSAPSFGFGQPAANTSTFGFGGLGSTSTASFGFGTGTNTAATGAGAFGATATGQAQDNEAQQLAMIAQAVSLPQIFGDERDSVIAKWNQLQALWGKGKGYMNRNQSAEFKQNNPFCKFKAVGYNCLPSGKNEDGLVSLVIKLPPDEVKPHQQLALDTLHKILGSKTQHTVYAEALNPLPDKKTELVVYVMERPQVGPAKRIPATELYNVLTSMAIKAQVVAQLNVETITAKVLMKEQLKHYLDHPPAGINPLLWQQAILDNPDQEKLIPVPMIGFKELHVRQKFQEQQTQLHKHRLNLIAEDLRDFQNKQGNMLAKLDEYKRKHLELSHRLLQIIVKQEMLRKQGFSIQVDEEQLRVQLEAIQNELNHPTQFKGRLNELMSQIRMQNHLSASRQDIQYQMDPSMIQEIKMLLKQQQEGLAHLVSIIKEDAKDLDIMEQGLGETTVQH